MTSLSPSQLRAARGLLNWSRADLSKKTSVSEQTLHRFENGTHDPEKRTKQKLTRALEVEGIEFLDNDGIRRYPQNIEVFVGIDRFQDFTEFVYQYLVKNGGDVCISAVDETQFQKYRKNIQQYRERMIALINRGDVSVRILASKSHFDSPFAQMKWQPPQSATPTSFYAFGDCLALISFDHDHAPYVALHKSGPFAEAYRQSFNISWKNAINPPKEAFKTATNAAKNKKRK